MKSIKDTYQGSDGKQYVNYDAAWGRFTNKMRDSVAYAEANGQEPGTYYSPFITHEHQFKQEVPGTNGNYLFEDLLLRDKDGKSCLRLTVCIPWIPPIQARWIIFPMRRIILSNGASGV